MKIIKDLYTSMTGGVLSFATYYASKPVLEDEDCLPLLVDKNGNLKVTGSGGSESTAHAGDGSEETLTLDTTGDDKGLITFYAPGGTGTYAIEEAVSTDSTRWDEIQSGSLVADTLETVRLSTIYGGALRIKVTSSVAVEIEAITKG